MKKLLIILMLFFGIISYSFSIDLYEEFGFTAYIESYDVSISINGEIDTHEEYYIYIGNETTQTVDSFLAKGDLMSKVTYYHPTAEVAATIFNFEAHLNWYVSHENTFVDPARRNVRVNEVFNDTFWAVTPQPVKHIIFAFGANNDNLSIIYFSDLTGGVRIYFHNRFADNLEYYESQLRTLNTYFNQLDDFFAPLNFSR